jgi:hypothetical protein
MEDVSVVGVAVIQLLDVYNSPNPGHGGLRLIGELSGLPNVIRSAAALLRRCTEGGGAKILGARGPPVLNDPGRGLAFRDVSFSIPSLPAHFC